MSDKRIDQLQEKPSLSDSDLIVVSEGSGTTWKATVQKFRDYLFGLVDSITGPPDRKDFVFFRRFDDGGVRRVPIEKLLPDGVVTNDMIADGDDESGTGITASKLAPSSVTHPKLAVDAVHTHNIANAEIANIDNYPPKLFGTGVTTEKICDGAVTGIKGGVPPGAVFHFAARTAPEGYLLCNGDTISDDLNGATQGVPNWRLQDLRSVLGNTFGAQGKLPDLRGVFVRSYGGGQGSGTSAHSNLDNIAGAIGRSSGSDNKHLISTGIGTTPPKSGSVVATEAINANSGNDSITEYFVCEYTDDAATINNPGDGRFAPRSNSPVGAVAFSKDATTIGIDFGGNVQYKIYAMRRLSSGPFGQHQEQRYMRHTHAVSESGHSHANEVGFNRSLIDHDHRISINVSGYADGGKDALRPHDTKSNGTFGQRTSDALWNNGWQNPVSITNKVATSNLTCENSVSYGYSASQPSVAPVFSRPTNVSDLSDPVDETRPANVALLPCIKY